MKYKQSHLNPTIRAGNTPHGHKRRTVGAWITRWVGGVLPSLARWTWPWQLGFLFTSLNANDQTNIEWIFNIVHREYMYNT